MTLLADAIQNMGNAALLRAFERQHLSAEARSLIRDELLRRLDRGIGLVGSVRKAKRRKAG